MAINWTIVTGIAVPIICVLLGAVANDLMRRGPRLIVYFGHASAFTVNDLKDAQGNPLPPATIHTHTLIIRNVGRATAHNVRVGHFILPDNFNVWRGVQHRVEAIPGGAAKDIVINTMVPREELQISYLYGPPLTFNQIHSGVKSDEGLATGWNVTLERVWPRWLLNLLRALLVVGVVATVYVIVEVGIALFAGHGVAYFQ